MLEIYDVKCEYRENPIGICVKAPRFSWKIKGENGTRLTAYRVQARNSALKTVWDTGRVEQESYFAVEYAGEPLEVMHRYTYIVTVWDNKGNNALSAPHFFETGFFALDDWKTKWITAKPAQGPMHIRADFNVKKEVKLARLYAASTAGAFWNNSSRMNAVHLTLNGKRVSEECFTPGQLSDRKWRALYRAYDITDILRVGENTLGGVILSMAFGAYITVTYNDGSADSFTFDENFKTNVAGPYHLWDEGTRGQGGKCEGYNANKEYKGFDMPGFDDSDWSEPVLTDVVSSLAEQTVITRVIESIEPISITKKGYTHYIVDFGQNINGHIRLTLHDSKAKRRVPGGDRVSVKYGEALYANGEINFCSTINYNNGENGPHMDSFISGGEKLEVFEPRFSNHGFRYADIINYAGVPAAEDIRAQLVHSEILDGSYFSCSDEDINKLFNISRWSQRDNLVSVPTDCPSRERLGWLGDALVVSESECINFDLIKFYENWCRNMEDDQEDTGNVQYISPYPAYKPGNTDIPWSTACVLIPWFVYQVYGDTRILRNSYPMITRWLGYIDTLCGKDNIICGGITWNDHTAVKKMNDNWLATLYYYICLSTASKVADTLCICGDGKKYAERADVVRAALRKNFKTENGFSESLQSDLAHAVFFGITDETEKKAFAQALSDLIAEEDGFLTCGALGIFATIPALADNSFNDTVFKICKDKREGSFGGWITNHNATTAFESLRYTEWYSQNHPFLMGSITNWFYERLSGIRRTEAGYKTFVIDPYMPQELLWAQGKIDTLYGLITARWEKNGKGVTYTVSVPCGTTATLVTADKREITLESGNHIITL